MNNINKVKKEPSERVLRTRAFKAAGLDKGQISYAHTLKRMFSSWTLEKVIQEARNYQPMQIMKVG
jgi:hypothetical protein